MAYDNYHPDDCIAALATPSAQSALAIIRISGRGCVERLAALCSHPETLIHSPSHRAIHQFLRDPSDDEVVVEVIVNVYRFPTSYTGEDSADIMPHGSLPGVRRILDLLFGGGFREARRGEFTLRAFLNGKMDLTQAEAVREIVEAKSSKAQALALTRLTGGLKRRFDVLKARIVELVGAVELALDYPEEEIGRSARLDDYRVFNNDLAGEIASELDSIIAGYRRGRIYQEGLRVVIAGATNSGKSSLFNLLLREERAIVSEVHGTTRDYLESWISIRGVPVRLFDTAGFRSESSRIESEGIRRTQSLLESADFVLYLVDGTLPAQLAGEEPGGDAFSIDPERRIGIWSKADMAIGQPPDGYLPVSSFTGEGIEQLEDALERLFALGGNVGDDVVIESDHQRRCVTRCAESLNRAISAHKDGLPLDAVATDLADAIAAIGELTGEITRDDILEFVFENFCVGK